MTNFLENFCLLFRCAVCKTLVCHQTTTNLQQTGWRALWDREPRQPKASPSLEQLFSSCTALGLLRIFASDNKTMEEDSHASVLRAVHGEILAYGLRPVLCPEVANNEDSNTNKQQDATTSTHCMDTHGVSFVASAAGAFPPLRYRDGGEGEEGRVIMVRALTMFDELIVSAKVEEERGGASSGSTRSRRLKFDVSRWHDAWREEKKQQQQQPPPQQQPQEERQLQQVRPHFFFCIT